MVNQNPSFYKKILVPLDGTRFAESLLLHAISLASAFSAHVHLLRAVPFPSYIYTPPGVVYAGAVPILRPAVTDNEDAWEEDKKTAQNYLNTVEARFREEGLSVSSNVRFGAAQEIILEEAEARHSCRQPPKAGLISMARAQYLHCTLSPIKMPGHGCSR